jgi:hypothetical protein
MHEKNPVDGAVINLNLKQIWRDITEESYQDVRPLNYCATLPPFV